MTVIFTLFLYVSSVVTVANKGKMLNIAFSSAIITSGFGGHIAIFVC